MSAWEAKVARSYYKTHLPGLGPTESVEPWTAFFCLLLFVPLICRVRLSPSGGWGGGGGSAPDFK